MVIPAIRSGGSSVFDGNTSAQERRLERLDVLPLAYSSGLTVDCGGPSVSGDDTRLVHQPFVHARASSLHYRLSKAPERLSYVTMRI